MHIPDDSSSLPGERSCAQRQLDDKSNLLRRVMQHHKTMLKAVFLVAFLLILPLSSANESEAGQPDTEKKSEQVEEIKIFDHQFHLNMGPECTNCHITDQGPGLPVLNREYCKACHGDDPPKPKVAAASRRLDIQFPHRAHTNMFECLNCHQKTIDGSQTEGEPLITRPQCVACHKDMGAQVLEVECARCHGVNKRREKPKDHGTSWLRLHGKAGQWRTFPKHGRDCTLCHRRDACLTCHKTILPANHSVLWRMRSHGSAAAWNRNSCTTCHETGACVQCHRTTPPPNHTSLWENTHGLVAESKSNSRCATCHSLSWCAACHRNQ